MIDQSAYRTTRLVMVTVPSGNRSSIFINSDHLTLISRDVLFDKAIQLFQFVFVFLQIEERERELTSSEKEK